MDTYIPFNLHRHSSSGSLRKPVMQFYYSMICSKTHRLSLDNVPDYRTIREQHVQVEDMISYMISCECGLILIRRVTLQYLTGMNM
jgi:hypothetical protein